MDEKTNMTEYYEDSFDLWKHKKAATEVSRKKIGEMRAKKRVSLGKALLTIAALLVFILLFFGIMHMLQLGAV